MDDFGKILFNRLEELRIKNNGMIELSDVDGLIDGFMDTIKGHITNQSEMKIFEEIQKMAEQIKKVKQEVIELDPESLGTTFIPGATSELYAVTKATEHSTNIILDAAEVIQSTALKLADKVSSKLIVDKVTEIFEACNFQDVTGQRISKALRVLQEIDNSVTVLVSSFSSKVKSKTPNQKKTPSNIDPANMTDKDLLTGPQIVQPTQDIIDDLFSK